MMHKPVLYQEVLHFLDPKPGSKYIDGTVGAGGHSFGILEKSSPDGMLLGLDVDLEALALAEQNLEKFVDRVILKNASYTQMKSYCRLLEWEKVDGILLDLGASSMQFDNPDRGFSFLKDAPLDMRFSPEAEETASDLVNGLSEQDLADLIYQFGEERNSRKIARAIVAARPIETTTQLADIVARAKSSHQRSAIHPATRTFQALRIAVNHELESLQEVLPIAVSLLGEGGRLVVISFHSLEDRIVKRFFRQESRDCICPPSQPVCTCDHKAQLTILTKKPVTATQVEVQGNPRARSAKLRAAERKG